MKRSPGARTVYRAALPILAALVFSGGVARADYESAVLKDGPIGYWRLNETDGTTAVNLGSLGVAADGTYIGTVDLTAAGSPLFPTGNTAISVGPEDGSVQTGAAFLSDLSAFTMTAFINPADRANNRIGLFGQNDAIEFGFINPDVIQIWTPQGGSLNVDYTFPSGEWHYIAVVGDGTELRVYFDAVLAGTGGAGTANYGSSGDGFNIGGGGVFDGGGNQFTGSIDEVAVWDTALTDLQIQNHYAETQVCGFANRDISSSRYQPGETVSVTVTLRNLDTMIDTTITETFPMGWTVSGNPDMGVVDDVNHTISFTVNANVTSVTYELTIPMDSCETVEITGTIMAAVDCSSTIGGASALRCIIRVGGIIITEDDWDNFQALGIEPGIGNAATPAPAVVETVDGRTSLFFSGQPDDNLAFVVYNVNVTQMPDGADEGRFPIRVEARHTDIGAVFIRNLTVSPIPDTGFRDQASFAAVMIRANVGDIFAHGTGPQPFNPCFDFLDRDEGIDIVTIPWSDVGDGNAALATDLLGQETGEVQTITVMLDLVLGENILRIDTTDLREPPCSTKGESGHQIFTLQIGPGETDLQGELVAAVVEITSLSVSPAEILLAPGGSTQLTVTATTNLGSTQDVSSAADGTTYAVDPEGVVTVSADGLMAAVATGQAEITATHGAFSATATATVSRFIDLGDIVAGGDGTGNGTFAAVSIDDGFFLDRPTIDGLNGDTTDGDGVNPSPAESKFIDSVYFLTDPLFPINSLGAEFEFAPDEPWGNSWNHILANKTHNIDKNPPIEDVFAGGMQFTTAVGIHAAAGITFDLGALRAEFGDSEVHTFSTFVGTDGIPGNCENGADITLYVIYSDDQGALEDEQAADGLVFNFRTNGVDGLAYEGLIPPEAQFLSLVVGGRNGIGCAHGVFADPRILPDPDGGGGEPRFVRGDADANGSINLTDGIVILNFLFLGADPPACLDAADTDDDGGERPTLTDAVIIFGWLFSGGTAPRPPSPDAPTYAAGQCGEDVGDDMMDCATTAMKCDA